MKTITPLELQKRQLMLTRQETREYWENKLYEMQVKNNESKNKPISDEMVDQLLGNLAKAII